MKNEKAVRAMISEWGLLSLSRDRAALGKEAFNRSAFRNLAIATYEYLSDFRATYLSDAWEECSIKIADCYDFSELISAMSTYSVLLPGEDQSTECIATASQFVASVLLQYAFGLCAPNENTGIITAGTGVNTDPLVDRLFRYDPANGGMQELIRLAIRYREQMSAG